MNPAASTREVVLTPEGEGLRPYLDPLRMAAHFLRRRDLISQLAGRQIRQRYRGSVLGMFWSLLHPLIALAVYAFVLGGILRIRWGTSTSPADYPLILFSGLVAFNLFSEVLSASASMVAGNPHFVKKIPFPLEVLPVVQTLASLVQAGAGLFLLLAAVVIVKGFPASAAFAAAFVPLVLFTLWTSFVVAALCPFLRDLQHALPVALQLLFFATPIFYSLEMVPPVLQTVIAANPLTVVVTTLQGSLVTGAAAPWKQLGLWTILHGALLYASVLFFVKSKRAFPDVV